MNEPTLYVLNLNGFVNLLVSLYVDDLLVTGPDSYVVDDFKMKMKQEFQMTDLGEMTFFLGMEIVQKPDYICIHQTKYARELLQRFNMEACKSVDTPLTSNNKFCKNDGSGDDNGVVYRSLVGCLLYLTASRPDIMYAASVLSRYMQKSSEFHFIAAKRVLRYVKGTMNFGLKFSKKSSNNLLGYCDSDWAGSLEDSRSTTGFCFSFGSAMFTWNCKKRDVVAQSTAEAKYIAATIATNHALWLRKMLKDIGFKQREETTLWIDNQSAIDIANNPVHHGRTKHIRVKYHAIRDAIKEKEIAVYHYNSSKQLADILTKSLSKERFVYLKTMLGVCEIHSKEVR
ncbi:PREDICTED: uncharacterized mitochondrial protein AtMg00810-like [Theobroma cacao]|uniref:Uncharacterized mitochondrial protein AtMg00810-like n=1 Tax=Theobroma cacao TaxID=3641 RepID=A0AB32WQN5_THECC|nr:PREDICTED: uncharacterized mitochondrial protein AtMg00810-like [Theobroma cacao]